MPNYTDYTIGVIGMGFVGGSIFRGFAGYADMRGYDHDDSRSTHTFAEALDSDFVFIAVPTPMERVDGGRASMEYIEAVLERIVAAGYRDDTVFVIKSTIPPGTTQKLIGKYKIYTLVHSPEFLTERHALIDFLTPSRHIIGAYSSAAGDRLEKLYNARFPGVAVHRMRPDEAELVKYGANCFFATKVMFFNELYLLSHAFDMDWDAVMGGIMADGRIGMSHNAVPGHDGDMGFGGKCFPKDLNGLLAVFGDMDLDPKLMRAAWEQNKVLRENWDWAEIKGAVCDE